MINNGPYYVPKKVCHVSNHLRWDNGGVQMTHLEDFEGVLPKVKEMGKRS